MSYTENGDKITLVMSRSDYDNLLIAVGIAAGVASHDADKRIFYSWIDFANRLNTGNPHFKQYSVPEEFKVPRP